MAIGAETVFAISKSIKELLGDRADEVNSELATRDGKLTIKFQVIIKEKNGQSEVESKMSLTRPPFRSSTKFSVDEDQRNLFPELVDEDQRNAFPDLKVIIRG